MVVFGQKKIENRPFFALNRGFPERRSLQKIAQQKLPRGEANGGATVPPPLPVCVSSFKNQKKWLFSVARLPPPLIWHTPQRDLAVPGLGNIIF